MRWQCRTCGELCVVPARQAGDRSLIGVGRFHAFFPQKGVYATAVAVVHMTDEAACGPCDPVPEEPEEAAPLTVDEIMGHVAASLRRTLPGDKAQRMIDRLHTELLWGGSIDHETQERADMLHEALQAARDGLDDVAPIVWAQIGQVLDRDTKAREQLANEIASKRKR